MRIRKRFPTASVPLADPKLNGASLVVQLQSQPSHGNLHFQECKTNSQPSDPPNQPSDQWMMIPDDQRARWVSPANSTETKMKQKDLEGEEIKDDDRWVLEEEKKKKNSNDIMRKECTLNAEGDISLLLSSSSSDQVDGRWGEGDKVVPLKKRKGSFERVVTKEEITVKAKWKSKTNKKCLQLQNGDDELNEKIPMEGGVDSGDSTKKEKKKKKKRGNVIMEGSRCSRVNGRGWRCCQQTLVGYSLCEHHLGKGRLRSMSSVRNRAMATNSTIAPKVDESSQALLSLGENQKEKKLSLLMDHNEDGDHGEDNEDQKPRMVTKKKKKKKLGTVKARSMSSLLGQTENAVAVANSTNSSRQVFS